MRGLGLIALCLLLAGCTTSAIDTPGPTTARQPEALTATAAFGDLRTVDYCTLLDAAGGEQVSSFEVCKVDPCPLITGPEFAALAGDSVPTTSPNGHPCTYGDIGLAFGVGEPSSGVRETIGGRQAVIETDVNVCVIYFERPLPDRPGLVERAQVNGIGARACNAARPAAELVAPKLPQ